MKFHRRLGIRAAEIVEETLRDQALPWLTLQSRMNLPSIFEEHKLWLGNIVSGRQETAAPHDLVRRADLLVVGTTLRRRRKVDINLRLVVARTGSIIGARSVEVELSGEMRALLPFVDAGESEQDVSRARVTDIELIVKAQRALQQDGRVEEWPVANGDELRCGDQFNVRFIPDADACIYIYSYGSDGSASLLYPPRDWREQFHRQYGRQIARQEYYCRAEWPYLAPGRDAKGRELFYRLDEVPGENHVYVCASLEKVPDVENIRRRLGHFGSHERRVRMLGEVFDYVGSFRLRQSR
jgi:hypothetical protein